MENNLLHRSGAKSTLLNVTINGFSLLSHIFIWAFHFCFAVTWCPSVTSICLSISSNKHGIKPETCGTIWHVDTESKIQSVNYKLSPKYLLGIFSLPDIRAIDAYIFWSLLFLPFSNYFCDARLPLSLKRTGFCHFSLYLGGFGHLTIRRYLDLHLKNFSRFTFSLLLVQITGRTSFLLLLYDLFERFTAEWLAPPKKFTFSRQYFLSHYFCLNLNFYQDLDVDLNIT